MVDFYVVKTSRGDPTPMAEVVLQKDAWDDFGFKTQYHLFYFGDAFKGFVGNVKILRRNQKKGASERLPDGSLDPLSEEYCSLGQSLDYYERLAQLPLEVRTEILTALRDVLLFPQLATTFALEDAWHTSVIRDLDLDSYVPLARVLLDRDYDALPSLDLKLRFTPRDWKEPLTLHFAGRNADGVTIGKKRIAADLPERVAVVTGANGSGKSTLLARLARVLHASQTDRKRLFMRKLGRIKPEGVGFTRVIAVSYSAFDTFHVPGVTRAEKRQIMTDLREGVGRYVFLGLRDIAQEIQNLLEEEADDEDEFEFYDVDLGDFSRDRQRQTALKTADDLASEFSHLLTRIQASGRMDLYREALELLLADASFADVPDQDPDELLTDDPVSMFLSRSTGHKIVLHTVTGLTASIQPKSIILMDEPETHLHPPLLAAMMHAVRHILAEQDAFCVIATHSPVVAQETLGEHVSIIRRTGQTFRIRQPRIETYGESIGELTEEIFGLHSEATDFHKVLDALVDKRQTLKQIDALFEGGMSLQARAYVMSSIATRDLEAD